MPAFRSKFFELYYGRYLRPIRDYVVAAIEHLVPWMARMPGVSNALAGRGPGRALLQAVGLVATPLLSGLDIDRELRKRVVAMATPEVLRALSAASARAASSSCRTPSPAITKRRFCSICST